MRILHVAAIEAGRPSGPATSVPLQMRAELGAGHHVGFLQSYGGAPAALPEGVTVLGGWSPTRDLRSYCERAAFWPDIVHFHSVYLLRHAVLARAARRLGLPTISSPRGGLMPRALAHSALKKRIGNALFFDAFSRGLTLHRAIEGFFQRGGEQLPLPSGTYEDLLREKALVLRSIKELEFDKAMGKVSEADFTAISSRLRARALSLMADLDRAPVAQAKPSASTPAPARVAAVRSRSCGACGTANDADARFCKSCGSGLEASK